MRSKYCAIEANYRWTRSIARPLCDSRSSFLHVSSIVDNVTTVGFHFIEIKTKT